VQIVLGLATLFGGLWAIFAFVRWVKSHLRKPTLPAYTHDQLRQRLTLLAIDDNGFTYEPDFRRENYRLTTWNRLDTYQALDNYPFDLIILDIQGIARHLSDEDGLGVARHLRDTMPSLAIMIYSSANYQISVDTTAVDKVFNVAGGDYQKMKHEVDYLFDQLTSPDFYLRKLRALTGRFSEGDLRAIAERVTEILIDPKAERGALQLSCHEATTTAIEVCRYARVVAGRLHQLGPL